MWRYFAFSPRDRQVVYASVLDRWVGWEPNGLLLGSSPPVFVYYSCLMLCWFEDDKAHIWRISIMEFLVFALVSFVTAASDCFFMSKTAYLHIVADGLVMLVQMSDGLAHYTDDLDFFPIVCKTFFDLVMAYVALCSGKGVYWSSVDLGNPFFLYRRRSGEVMGLTDKRVHERRREADSRLIYHERLGPFIAVQYKSDLCLSSL